MLVINYFWKITSYLQKFLFEQIQQMETELQKTKEQCKLLESKQSVVEDAKKDNDEKEQLEQMIATLETKILELTKQSEQLVLKNKDLSEHLHNNAENSTIIIERLLEKNERLLKEKKQKEEELNEVKRIK